MKKKEIVKDECLEYECITIVGMDHYYGGSSVEKGSILKCEKEPENEKDHEAIVVKLPVVGRVAYVANNTFTVLPGTLSAGRVYDKVENSFYVKVVFRDEGKAIAQLLRENEATLEKLWKESFFETKK